MPFLYQLLKRRTLADDNRFCYRRSLTACNLSQHRTRAYKVEAQKVGHIQFQPVSKSIPKLEQMFRWVLACVRVLMPLSINTVYFNFKFYCSDMKTNKVGQCQGQTVSMFTSESRNECVFHVVLAVAFFVQNWMFSVQIISP